MRQIHRTFKLARAAAAGVRLVRDPSRLDAIIAVARNVVSPDFLRSIVDELSRQEVPAQALAERPRLQIDLDCLARLPRGTLGRAFADHMRARGLDPAALPRMEANDPLSFVRAHLFETHDVWHVVTGFDTDVAGELGLQAFYMAQLPARFAPLLLVAGLANTLLYSWPDRTRRMDEIARGWRLGRGARPFFGVPWAALWSEPLEDVRARLGVPG
jgi:ubiquinone biosynthesis protein Coq4